MTDSSPSEKLGSEGSLYSKNGGLRRRMSSLTAAAFAAATAFLVGLLEADGFAAATAFLKGLLEADCDFVRFFIFCRSLSISSPPSVQPQKVSFPCHTKQPATR
jgi:hypothetical protein